MDLWIASLQFRCIWDIFGLKTKLLRATRNHNIVKSPISKLFSFLQPRLQNPLSFLQPLAAEWLKTAADFHIGCRNYISCRKTAYLRYPTEYPSFGHINDNRIRTCNEPEDIFDLWKSQKIKKLDVTGRWRRFSSGIRIHWNIWFASKGV